MRKLQHDAVIADAASTAQLLRRGRPRMQPEIARMHKDEPQRWGAAANEIDLLPE